MTVWFLTQEKNKRQLEFASIWLFEVHFSKCNLWMLLVKHASKFLHLMGKDSAAKVREKMKVESSSSSGKKSLQEDRWHHQRQHTLNTTAKLSVNWTYWIHYFFYCIDKKAKKVFFWVIIHCWLCPAVQIANWGIYSDWSYLCLPVMLLISLQTRELVIPQLLKMCMWGDRDGKPSLSEPCVGEKKVSAVSPHSTAKKAVILGSWMYHAFGWVVGPFLFMSYQAFKSSTSLQRYAAMFVMLAALGNWIQGCTCSLLTHCL